MNRKHDNDTKQMVNKAEELVALTFEVCEKRLSSVSERLSPPQVALSAAAMNVHHSVETFLAVSRIPVQPEAGK